MTLVNIDLQNAGYETGPDDRVVFYSLLVREGDFGTISTAPVEVPLVEGKATVDLAPGPVGVQIIAGQVADTRVREGRVPMEGPTTLNVVLTLLPEYSDAVRQSFLAAIRSAQDTALTRIDAEVAVAVDAEMSGVTALSEEALSRAKAAEGVASSADTKATTATSTASTAVSTAGNAVARVTALEAMAGMSPESPVDGQQASLISQPGTLTHAAISSLLGSAPMVITFGVDAETARPDTDRPVMWIGYGVPTYRRAGDIVVQAVMEWPVHLDLIAWYDATTAGPTGDLIAIADRGPNGLDMTTKVGSITVESGGISPPVFAFDSALISTAPLGFDPALWAYPLTVYLVASVDSTGSTEALFDTTHSTHKATISRTSDGKLSVATSGTKESPSGVFPADTPVIISVTLTTEGIVGEVNGVSVLTDTPMAAPTDPVTRLRLGGNYGGGFMLNGSLGEVIIAHEPTPSDHTSTLEYLAEKWGITL